VDVHSHPTYPPPYLNDCATTDFSALSPPVGTGQWDGGYDPETRIYTLQAYLAKSEGSVTFYLSVDDAACQNVHYLDEEIDSALADNIDALVGDCADIRNSLTGAAPPMPNPEGAQDFIDSWCGDTGEMPVATDRAGVVAVYPGWRYS